MKKIYNKLVRDKIPGIILSNGAKNCKTRVLDDDEYLKYLKLKLQEEVNEYLESEEIEELADIEEVIRAILNASNVDYSELELIRNSKAEKRGAFNDKIYLESVEED